MKILEFVITGGPCAGKSTAINILKEKLSNENFELVIVQETATELISSGITPWKLGTEVFQSILISRAFNKEETARIAARNMKKDVIIIYDRGILDVKAYMNYDLFFKELRKYNTNENKVMENYDAVFHLVTAAKGAENYYTVSNNDARKETIEEAIVLDDKTIDAWKKHNNFNIIDNSTDFEEKINRLLKEIYKIIENVKK